MPDVATHITYEQALKVLGPYLDVYLAENNNERKPFLSRTAGLYEDESGNLVFGPVNAAGNYDPELVRSKGVISIESVKKMADYLHSTGHADFQKNSSRNVPDWPKETQHYQKPKAEKQ